MLRSAEWSARSSAVDTHLPLSFMDAALTYLLGVGRSDDGWSGGVCVLHVWRSSFPRMRKRGGDGLFADWILQTGVRLLRRLSPIVVVVTWFWADLTASTSSAEGDCSNCFSSKGLCCPVTRCIADFQGPGHPSFVLYRAKPARTTQ